jgi:hypothetical protein
MPGIILGALGGAGAAAQDAGAAMMKSDLDLDRQSQLATLQSNLELSRQQALEQFKVDTANQQREAQASRIATAAGGIADQQVGAKRSVIMSGMGDASTWTPEQQAVVDQSLANDRQSIMNAPSTRTQAAIATGDISPTEAAKLASASEINQMKLDSLLQRAQDRNATMQQIADAKTEAMKYGYELRLQAAQEKRLNGKIDSATTRMLITSEDANIRASTSQLNMLNNQLQNTNPTKGGQPNPAYESIKTQMEELRGEIAESKKRKLDLFKGLNIVPKDEGDDEGDTPTPSPAPAPASPAKKPPLNSFLK